jgi:hypothetical protein
LKGINLGRYDDGMPSCGYGVDKGVVQDVTLAPSQQVIVQARGNTLVKINIYMTTYPLHETVKRLDVVP